MRLPRVTNDSALARARIRKLMSQQDLAELLGTTSIVVSNWEYGRRYPSPEFMEKLVKVLGVPEDELFPDSLKIKAAAVQQMKTYIQNIDGVWYAFAGNPETKTVCGIGHDITKDRGVPTAEWTDEGIKAVAKPSPNYHGAYKRALIGGNFMGTIKDGVLPEGRPKEVQK